MPTSIVRIHTPSGFVIAADGYATGAAPDAPAAQKVFGLVCPFVKAGVGISGLGNSQFSNEDKELTITFLAECTEVADEVRSTPRADFDEVAKHFTQALAKRINKRIERGRRWGAVSDDDLVAWFADQERNKGTCLHFAGYCRDHPYVALTRVIFGKDGPRVTLEALARIPTGRTEFFFHGSKTVQDLLLTGEDPRFAQFRSKELLAVLRKEDASLLDGIAAAREYILACSSAPAREIDPFCNSIDGRIHVATVTAKEGFKLEIPPLAQ
jgi:hypothetical protein